MSLFACLMACGLDGWAFWSVAGEEREWFLCDAWTMGLAMGTSTRWIGQSVSQSISEYGRWQDIRMWVALWLYTNVPESNRAILRVHARPAQTQNGN
jgi:hypothetical protein